MQFFIGKEKIYSSRSLYCISCRQSNLEGQCCGSHIGLECPQCQVCTLTTVLKILHDVHIAKAQRIRHMEVCDDRDRDSNEAEAFP